MRDTAWVVWMKWGDRWIALPWTAKSTRSAAIAEYASGYPDPEREWRRQQGAGDVCCRRTTLTVEPKP